MVVCIEVRVRPRHGGAGLVADDAGDRCALHLGKKLRRGQQGQQRYRFQIDSHIASRYLFPKASLSWFGRWPKSKYACLRPAASSLDRSEERRVGKEGR